MAPEDQQRFENALIEKNLILPSNPGRRSENTVFDDVLAELMASNPQEASQIKTKPEDDLDVAAIDSAVAKDKAKKARQTSLDSAKKANKKTGRGG